MKMEIPYSVENDGADRTLQTQFRMQFEELQSVVFARMVNKVGDRLYWEQWAKSVAEIAEKQIARLNNLVEAEDVKDTFDEFLAGFNKTSIPKSPKNRLLRCYHNI